MIDLAITIKAQAKAGEFVPCLKNQTLAMIFEKSSTRTRVSFETGICRLGGTGLFLSSRDIQLGRGEPMIKEAIALFNPKRVRIKRKS